MDLMVLINADQIRDNTLRHVMDTEPQIIIINKNICD